MRHRVVVLALPGVVTFDLACATQIFADSTFSSGPSRYEFAVCGAGGRRVTTSDGLTLPLDHTLGALADADTVVVPGYRDALDQPPSSPALVALRAASARGARVVAFCIGAFALGHAGLLDGRRATTHWNAAPLLAAQFPDAQVDAGRLFVDDGNILTSAGLAAGLDLALHVVRRDHGASAAADIARWNVLAPHREGSQAQFIPNPIAATPDSGLGETRAWALEHLDQPLSVADLAAHAGCSERTLTRQFHDETGSSPKQWLLKMRLGKARELLEDTGLTIERVAHQAGFTTANSLRFHFAATLVISPTAYRRAFRGDGNHDTDQSPPL